ncbi:PEP-CTERM system TPR-repeat protein PrsT [Vibrio sp. CAIM 722]|uniref:PEP-CTERM system TPR-repeat protein PrsT n=2 Tax=Vibrio TaxID=662 RepID=A0A7X4LQ16_9VIBR|nr:PEP-CTERM system TPR-repeat protein PrsT [Vibrio eleionomae]
MDIHLHQASGNSMFQNKKSAPRAFLLSSITSSMILFSGLSYANDYVNSAQKYLSKNDISSATIELKNAIQSSPKDSEPRLLLGKIYLQNGNFPAAEKELSRSLHLGADKSTVVPLIAKTLVAMGRNDDAIELISESDINQPKARADLVGLQAIAEFNLRNNDNAKSLLTKLTSTIDKGILDKSVYFNLAQTRLSAIDNDNSAALSFVNKAIQADETNSDSWLLKGHIELALKNTDKAITDYKKAYSLSPAASFYSLYVARALVLAQKFKEASPYVDKMLSAVPNYPIANELKAAILYADKNYTGAKDSADRAINNGSKNTSTMLISAVSAYQLKLYEQADRRLKQVLPRLPADHFANRLYIVTLMKLGYVDEAIDKMESLDTDKKDNSSFVSQMSLTLSKLGRDDEALSLATKAYNSSKSNDTEMMLGMVKLADNDESGLKELRSAISQQPDQRKAEIGVAYYYLKLGKLDDAKDVADKWLKKNPKDTDALALKGQYELLIKDYKGAEATYKDLLKIVPDQVKAQESLARALLLQDDYDQAYKYAYQAKKKDPNSIAAIQLLFSSAQKTGRMDDVIELIDQQLKQSPSDLSLLHQKAFALITEQKTQPALTLLENIPDEEKTGETWSLIGNLYFMKKLWFDADRAYQKWRKLSPNSVNAYLRSIQVDEESDNLSAGIALTQKAQQQFPNDIRFPLIKINLLIKSKQIAEAQKLLNNLPAEPKGSVYALKLQERIHVANRDFPKALQLQEQIYKKAPGLVAARELASLYEASGERKKAIDFLQNEIETRPEKARPLQLLLADIQSRYKPEDAIEQYQTIIKREPKNLIALNNIAWLYINKNDYDTACNYSVKAYDMAKNQPVIIDTYGYCLLKQGNKEKNKEKVTEAVSLLSQAYKTTKGYNNAEIALHYAESLISNKQYALAKDVLNDIDTNNAKLTAMKSNLENLLKNI